MRGRTHPGSEEANLLAALSLGAAARSRGGAALAQRSGEKSLLYWVPVLVALLAFAQVSLLGLRPALLESARLNLAEDLVDRHQAEQARAQRLDRILRAQRDPIYLERERRLLLDPEAGLLRR